MTHDIKGIPYGGSVHVDPNNVKEVSLEIQDCSKSLNVKYEQLSKAEDRLCSEMGGDVAIDFKNTTENIDCYMEKTQKKLLEISETVEGYVSYMEEVDRRSAGGGVHYE